jgi:hypothetical protein
MEELGFAEEIADLDHLDDDYTCDDVRTAWLCAELSAQRAGIGGSFEALWVDR